MNLQDIYDDLIRKAEKPDDGDTICVASNDGSWHLYSFQNRGWVYLGQLIEPSPSLH